MDRNDDRTFSKTGQLNGTSMVGTTDTSSADDAGPPAAEHPSDGVGAGLRPGFLAELAVAMRATAEKERERISAQVSEDAAGHIEKVRARAAIETDELKRLAEEDVQHIEEWAAAEMERIRGEADKKVEDRRGSLEEYLKQHDTIIETEIDGVNAAVRDYGTTLDAFFAELSQSDDPATIVARAEALPVAPDLDQVRARARSSAVAIFADQEDDAAAAENTIAENAAEPIVAEPIAAEPVVADTSADPGGTAGGGASTEAAPAVAGQATEIGGDAGVEAQAETAGEATTGEATTGEAQTARAQTAGAQTAGAAAEAHPVPVMDPDATANPNWPPAPDDAEPVEVAASADHTSAAVRLLRSVAPWTAPTHAGSDDRSNTD